VNAFAPLSSAANALTSAGLAELQLDVPGGGWTLLVGLVCLAFVFFTPRRRPWLLHSRVEAAAALPRAGAAWLPALARALSFVAASLVLVALCGPTAPGEPDPRGAEGIDIVVVLDVSGSMRAADFKPRDRLTVAKRVIGQHVLTREGDRIGLVVFAGEAFTQAPLTHDRELLAEILEGVRTGVITDGTAIGDAVATGVNRLRDSEAKGKALILLTDGDNNAGNLAPEKAAELAKEFGIRIFPVLIGKGGRVPYPSGGRDVLGMPSYGYAVFPVNPDLLKSLADGTDGRFFAATSPRELETSLQRILGEMDKTRLQSGAPVRRPVDLYPLAVLPALLLLGLALVLSMTRASTVP
jgi:Ca-activated chloride channel family protein